MISKPGTSEAFYEALKAGEAIEAKLRRILSDANWGVFPGASTATHDFACHNGQRWYLVEVKDESNYKDSPNLCIETIQGADNKPSGISVSESTVTIHYFGARSIVYRTNAMRLFIRANHARYRVQPFGKSDNENQGVLVPVFDVKAQPWCQEVETLRLHESSVWDDECLKVLWPAKRPEGL